MNGLISEPPRPDFRLSDADKLSAEAAAQEVSGLLGLLGGDRVTDFREELIRDIESGRVQLPRCSRSGRGGNCPIGPAMH